jgi:hypothetical protein
MPDPRQGRERNDAISEVLDGLEEKAAKEMLRITTTLANVERKRAQGNAFAGVGVTLKEYADTLRDVVKRQRDLRNMLMRTTDVAMDSIGSQIESLYADVQADDSKLQRAYGQLPEDVRKLLETGEQPAAGGSWQSHRVRDFANGITLQSVRVEGGRIEVSSRSETEPDGATVTESLATADVIPQSIVVQSTDAGRWIVMVATNGRMITKRTPMPSGEVVTDHVSKLTLFFSDEATARAAADALRSSL